MGLDITAYSGLTHVGPADWEQADKDERILVVSDAVLDFVNTNWPGRATPLQVGNYTFRDDFDFRAGSYSGYQAWRSWLARIAGFINSEDCWNRGVPGNPFYELIHFADNEGFIGSEVSKKLAADFAAYQTKAEAANGWPHDREYDLQKYREWRQAFELATDNGCVAFH